MELKPSEIFFTQRQINNFFKKGTAHGSYMIGQTLDDLCMGRCTVQDIPQIQVMWERGKWWTADNRRLWVFRQFETLGGCEKITVTQTYYIDPRKKDSPNGGTSVVVRNNDPGGTAWRRGHTSRPIRQPLSRYTPNSALDGFLDDLSRLNLGSDSNTRGQRLGTRNAEPALTNLVSVGLSDKSDDDDKDDELWSDAAAVLSEETVLRSLPSPRQSRSPAGANLGLDKNSLSPYETIAESVPISGMRYHALGRSTPRSDDTACSGAVSYRPDNQTVVILDPREVKFTKKRIGLLMRGRHIGRPSSVYDLWIKLVDGTIIPEYIPPVEVFHLRSAYWVVSGNKRLLAFRKAAEDLPGLLIQAVVLKDSSQFVQKVNENSKTDMCLADILAINDNVEEVDDM